MIDENINKDIKKSILKTIIFFDLFDYPLTEFEIWKYLNIKTSLFDVVNILDNANLVTIKKKNGFYFLNGRKKIINTRMKRNDYACEKLKRANFVAKIFRNISSIKMIAVSNIIGDLNLKEGSDIDLFIITDKNKIWKTRFLCVIILKLLNSRPKANNVKNKICLSFFVTNNHLNIEKLKIEKDLYFNYWMTGLMPIYNIDYTYEKFISGNDWLKKEFPNWKMFKNGNRYFTPKGFCFFIKLFVVLFSLPGEFLLKKLQMFMFAKNIKENINHNTKVVVNDNILKLHVTDRRKEYKEEFVKKIHKIFT